MIYAIVDVCFPNHPRVLKAGDEAAFLWIRCLCYSREHELDGFVPKEAIHTFPGHPRRKMALVKRLVEVGLLEDQEGGYSVPKYASKGNETKAMIAERKQKNTERQREFREREASRNAPRNALLTRARAPGSGSSSDLDLGERGEVQEGGEPEAAPEPPTEASPREQDYQRAYERGVAEGKGSPYAMPENQRAALHQAILAHAKDREGKARRGEDLLRWITSQARQFAAFVQKKPDELKFWSGYGPRGWLKWLNETPIRRLPRPAPANDVRPPEPIPIAAPEPPLESTTRVRQVAQGQPARRARLNGTEAPEAVGSLFAGLLPVEPERGTG